MPEEVGNVCACLCDCCRGIVTVSKLRFQALSEQRELRPLPGLAVSGSCSCLQCEGGSEQLLILVICLFLYYHPAWKLLEPSWPGLLEAKTGTHWSACVRHHRGDASAMAVMPALALRSNCFLASLPSRSALMVTNLVMALSEGSSICALFAN